ncbi:MAG: stage II sporulation protein P [Alkaliphilus sp.]|nr:stage II sporulation protein P [Alkaliphilus sp.]MBS3995002.1 stage II sporulation protein P [Alkaliphilus sp.]
MTRVRRLEIRKYSRWMYIIFILLMCLITFSLIVMDDNIVVRAKSIGELDNQILRSQEEMDKNKLFLVVLSKSYPMLEVNYELEHGEESLPQIYRLALEKIIKFDYRDPRSFLRAQIPVLSEVNDDLGEISYSINVNQPDYEPENNGNDQEIFFVDRNETPVPVDVPKDVPVMSIQETDDDRIVSSVPIVSSSIKRPNKTKLDAEKPTILIYHTHGTESYLPEKAGNFRSLNKKYTVRSVGEQLTKHLTRKGHNVVHDETIHDYPSFQQSYVRGLETLKSNLDKNQSIKIIFDIHRDAAPESPNARENSIVLINNEKVARFCMVVGTRNDNAEQLMIFAEYIRAKSDELYPGLAKATITKDFRFNQYNSDYYALIEVGNTANNIEEALRTSKYLAEIIDSVIQDIRE